MQAVIEKIGREIGVPYIDVVCYKEHEEVFRYTYAQKAMGNEQLYMYSCGKPITVVAALRLVEEGKMSLEDKVCVYLPEVKNAFLINKQGEMECVGDKMTIRHLFTMSAGFTYDLATEPILKLVKDSQGKATLRAFIAKFVETPLSFMPGERFQYSLCHDVLAAVVEAITQKKYSEYVKDVVFAPLQMAHSRFDNGETDMLDMYKVNASGEIQKTNGDKLLIPTTAYESGGAGLVSTVDDYIRFADALACGGVASTVIKYCDKKPCKNLYPSN